MWLSQVEKISEFINATKGAPVDGVEPIPEGEGKVFYFLCSFLSFSPSLSIFYLPFLATESHDIVLGFQIRDTSFADVEQPGKDIWKLN